MQGQYRQEMLRRPHKHLRGYYVERQPPEQQAKLLTNVHRTIKFGIIIAKMSQCWAPKEHHATDLHS